MTLNDKLTALLTSLNLSRSDIREALLTKGIRSSSDIAISEVAQLIAKINIEEWNFFMYFDDIDQFGTPHALLSGAATGGFYLYDPSFELQAYDTVGLDMTNPLTFTLPAVGAFGVFKGFDTPIVSSLTLDKSDIVLDFNIDTLPEELNYVNVLD